MPEYWNYEKEFPLVGQLCRPIDDDNDWAIESTTDTEIKISRGAVRRTLLRTHVQTKYIMFFQDFDGNDYKIEGYRKDLIAVATTLAIPGAGYKSFVYKNLANGKTVIRQGGFLVEQE